jgi:FlaA1/EpsC-like NDP-sugar epimerase
MRIPHKPPHLKFMLAWGAIDFSAMFVIYSLLYLLRTLNTTGEYTSDIGFIVLYILITLASLYGFKVYHRIWNRTSGHGITIIAAGMIVSTSINMAINTVIMPQPLPVSIVLVGAALNGGVLVSLRYKSRLLTGLAWRWRAVWKGEFPEDQRIRTLIVGAGESGQNIAMRLKYREEGRKKYNVIGFIDDDPAKRALYVEGAPVIGTREDIERLVKHHKIELVIVAIHRIKGADMRDILTHCENSEARIQVVPDLLDSTTGKMRDVQPEDLLGRNLITRHEAVDLTPVTGKRVLITGAAGSIGAELTRQMMTYQPHCIVALDNNESSLHDLVIELRARYPGYQIEAALVDITHANALRTVFAQHRPEVVFHAAAYKHVPMLEQYPAEALRVNVGGTYHLVKLATEFKVERFVMISTDKAVEPSSVMGASKRLCELLIHAAALQNGHATRFTAVRFGNVLGSRGSVVPTFAHQIDAGGPVTVTHPDMTRYFMTIPEAVNLVIHAACLTRGDDIFVLRMGEVVKIVDIAERMIRMRGLRVNEDIKIEFSGVRPGEKMHEALFNDGEDPTHTHHPDIYKVNTWEHSFDPHGWLARIEHLIQHGLDSTRSALEQFTGYLTMSQPTLQTSPPAPEAKPDIMSTLNGKHGQADAARDNHT